MSANSCPRCAKVLPETILRALPQGTACPFCAAPLKRTPSKRATTSTTTAPAGDDGYATFEVSAAPPPAPAPAKIALPGSTASAPRNLRATMVGTAAAARGLPFDGAPAPASLSLAPPVSTSAPPPPVRAPEPPMRATATATPPPPVRGAAAALARTIAAPAPAPARAPSTRAALAPAAGRPARTLTPAQALDLPPPTPMPLLNTPPPVPIAPARAVATARPLVTESDSGPTRVSPEHARRSAAVSPLVIESDSGPTSVAPSPASRSGAVAPVLTFPDSEPIIDSVTVTPDTESPPAAVILPPPAAPRRGLALIGIGMGMAIIVLAFVGFRLIRGPRTAAGPVAVQAAKLAPEAQPAPPVVEAVPAEPAPPQEAPPAKTPPAKAPLAKTDTPAAPKAAKANTPPPVKLARQQAAREREDEDARPVAEAHAGGPRRRGATHRSRSHDRHASHARQVAMREPAPKRSSTPPPAEHADPRPPYEHGNALLFAGDGKGALAAYREAVKTAPSDPIGFRGLGLAYEQQGEPALAIRALRRYLKLAPDAPDRELIAKRIDKLSKRAKQK